MVSAFQQALCFWILKAHFSNKIVGRIHFNVKRAKSAKIKDSSATSELSQKGAPPSRLVCEARWIRSCRIHTTGGCPCRRCGDESTKQTRESSWIARGNRGVDGWPEELTWARGCRDVANAGWCLNLDRPPLALFPMQHSTIVCGSEYSVENLASTSPDTVSVPVSSLESCTNLIA